MFLHMALWLERKHQMTELGVHIVTLEPMRVASAHAFGATPEREAWTKLIDWATPRGLLDDPQAHRIFGFNNPNPSAGSPNYGYEFWIEVEPDLHVRPEDEVKVLDYAGGRYAVTRCEHLPQIGQVWKRLVAWLEGSPYVGSSHQWLEEHIAPDPRTPHSEDKIVLDLYLPIAE